MSYKIDLSHHPGLPLTQQLVERFARAIDDGLLAPGEKLPTTRELARDAEVNHLTAARVYRRLAELGYVTASVGRGTFVRALPPVVQGAPDEDWQIAALPPRTTSWRERMLQDVMRLAAQGDVVTLAAALPDAAAFPTAELRTIADAVFAEEGGGALGYGDVEGLPALRRELATLGARQGFASSPDEIIVTSGARQAVDLVARTVLGPGDTCCVESPSFVGSLVSLEGTGARVLGVPVDADGLDVVALERHLTRHEVKLVALQSACQNPTGRSLAPERRRRLLELARERSFFVLEDGVYSRLGFDGAEPAMLRAEAPDHVIYVDSTSKTIGGGLRIGWIAASGPVFARLSALKMATDLHTSSLDQHIVARYLASGSHEELLVRARGFYRERCDALLAALDRHLAGEYDALRPLGGHNLWLTLRRRVDERALYAEALRHGVTFTPGHAALVDESGRAAMRLSFSLATPERLDEGIRRLSAALRSLVRADGRSATGPFA